MNAKELAAKLNGRYYNHEVTRDEIKAARDAGLVIAYVTSYHHMEFKGAIRDEFGSWNHRYVMVDTRGVIPAWKDIRNLQRGNINFMRDWFDREGGGKNITALLHAAGYVWVCETEIPHETFDIMSDVGKYCRGIVFVLTDVGSAP